MKFWGILLFWLSILLPTSAFSDQTIILGTTTVTIQVTEKAGGLTYFAPHDDENTAVQAAKSVITQSGGKLIELKHSGTRNVRFVLGGRRYEFDPNRMFSDVGIRATLRAQGAGNYSSAAHVLVAQLAKAVLSEIATHRRPHTPIVALHNNTNGAFTINSYVNGNLQKEAVRVSVNNHLDTDDFFLVTSSRLFTTLCAQHQNVAEQSARPSDDGSLSVYAAKVGMPYVNVEAQDGHLSIQLSMLKLLQPH